LPVVLASSALKPTAVFGPSVEVIPAVFVKSANDPTAVFPESVMLSLSAFVPTAVLFEPDVLKNMAAAPIAVFDPPLLVNRLAAPIPVLKAPLLSVKTENHPRAELKLLPECSRALNPSAVLLFTGKGDGSGLSGPPAPYASPKQASTEKIVANIANLLRFFMFQFYLSFSPLN
jgi:hypothetical protein